MGKAPPPVATRPGADQGGVAKPVAHSTQTSTQQREACDLQGKQTAYSQRSSFNSLGACRQFQRFQHCRLYCRVRSHPNCHSVTDKPRRPPSGRRSAPQPLDAKVPLKGLSHAPNQDGPSDCTWGRAAHWRFVSLLPGRERLWRCLHRVEHYQSDGASPPMVNFGSGST